MAGKFLLPAMPGIALLIARAVACVPWRAWRFGLGSAVAALALHHVIACTFLFPTDPKEPPYDFQRPASLKGLGILAYHRSFYLDWSRASGCEAVVDSHAVDYKIPAVVERIESLHLPADSQVAVLAEHVFFDSAPLQLEAARRGLDIAFIDAPSLMVSGYPNWFRIVRITLRLSSAALLRELPVRTPFDAAFEDANKNLDPPFVRAGEPIALEDGSRVVAFRRAR
jgi:hypothetical protein